MDGYTLPDWVPMTGERVERQLSVCVRFNKTSGSEVENRTTVIINTADPDRHGTRILPEGIDLSNYNNNPVVLINHDHTLLAANASISAQNGALVAHVEDDAWDLDDPEIAKWHRKLKKGMLKAASVGLIVHNVSRELIDNDGDHDDPENYRYVIDESEMIEWSFVTVGSNPQALVTQRMIDRQTVPAIAAAPSEAPPTAEPEPIKAPAPVAREASEDVPALPAPALRQATPAEYARMALDMRPLVRSEIKRLTGKR